MFFGFVLSKRTDRQVTRNAENHELIHVTQYWECFMLGAVIAALLTPVSWWFLILPFIMFYVLYGVEWLVAIIHHYFDTAKKNIVEANEKAYYNSAMEMEAYENQGNPEYIGQRGLFRFFAYYGKL